LNSSKARREFIYAFMMVRVEPQQEQFKLMQELMREPVIENLYEIAGEFDLLLKVKTNSTEELGKVTTAIMSKPSVSRTNTILVLKVHR